VAAYAEAIIEAKYGIVMGELPDMFVDEAEEAARAVLPLADAEMAALIQDRAQATAERDAARAEVKRLRRALDVESATIRTYHHGFLADANARAQAAESALASLRQAVEALADNGPFLTRWMDGSKL
jgi:hypothetical protein